MMKIVIAIDSFKGSCSAKEACEAIEAGILNYNSTFKVTKLPIADGGEGLIDILSGNSALNNKSSYHTLTVCGPYSKPVNAGYLVLNQETVIIEMAQACGLELTPKLERNALYATSYGLGELVKIVLDKGYRHIIIGLGGSATNDGGIGFAQALGVKFYDKNQQIISSPASGKDLSRVTYMDISDIHPAIKITNFEASCDVSNPLLGKNGATYIYGPQKGATEETLEQLEKGMAQYSAVVSSSLGADTPSVSGTGAAGGMGAALLWYTQATLKPGIELVLSLLDAGKYICDSDLVITGEGRLDRQSSFGKAPVGVANLAATYGKPTVAIAGSIGNGAEELYQHNIQAMWSICPGPIDLENSMKNAKQYLSRTAESLIRTVCLGKNI